MNCAGNNKRNNESKFRGGAGTARLQIGPNLKRILLYSTLFSILLLSISMASADITIQGELPEVGGSFIIKAFEYSTDCSDTNFLDSNTANGSTSYTGTEADYTLTISTVPSDLWLYFCTSSVAGAEAAYYHFPSVPGDGSTTQINLGRVDGTNLHTELADDYVIVCAGDTIRSTKSVKVDSVTYDYTQYYINIPGDGTVRVMLDNDATPTCTFDTTISTAKSVDLSSSAENYGIYFAFSPNIKATGELHSDLQDGNIFVTDASGLSRGMLALVSGFTGSPDYNLYYDDPASGTLTMEIYKAGSSSADETIYGLPNTFNVWDANIKVSGNVPSDIADVNTEIDTGITVSTNTVSGTPYTYALYIPDANEPILYFRHAGETVYQYTFAGSPVNGDTSVNVAKISGEAHSNLDSASEAGIQVFTDEICTNEPSQASGGKDYIVNPAEDPNGPDYNIYFNGSDGTYYLRVWYKDGTNDFNSCGNAVTVSNQEGSTALTVRLHGTTPAGMFTSATIDWNKDEGTDVNTTTFPSGEYYMFTQPDSTVRIKFFSDGNVVDLNVDKDLSGDLDLNVGNIAGDVLAAAGDGDASERIDVYSDAECTTKVSTEYEKPTNTAGAGNDYNQFYEATLGDANYYVYIRAHINGYDYNSCIRFDGGIGQKDTLNIDANLFGEYPLGVTRIAIDFNADGIYDVIGDSNAGTAPDINYYVLFPSAYDGANNDINVLGYGSISDNNVLLSRRISDLDANRDFNVAMISGAAHLELQEDGGSDTVKVYTAGSTTGDGTCSGIELSSEDITIGSTYVQYYESIINDQNIYIQVVDANSSYGTANTCINTRKIDTPGDANTFNLDKKLYGNVASGITKVQISLNDDADYDVNGTVVTTTTPYNYRIFHPAGSANADINFLSASGVELHFTSGKSLADNLQINVGKVTGAVHPDAATGNNDYITVHTTACTVATEVSTETEAAASNAYTQYFEGTDGTTYYVKLAKNVDDYNTCFTKGFTLTNQEASGIDFNRKISGTIPSRVSDTRTYFDVNSVGANIDGSAGDDYLATSDQDATYELYVDADEAGANDTVSFYSTYTGTDTLYSKTVDLSSDTIINLAYVFGETHALLTGTSDIIGVYSEQACSTQLNSVTAHPSTGSANADYNIYFEPVAGQTTYFLKVTDYNSNYDTNFVSYHKITVPADSNIAQVDLNGRLFGTVVEQYDGSTPIQDANVELLHNNGTDWNAYTFTNSDGNYALYSAASGTYDLRYRKAGYITRDWTTNAGEMNDISLDYQLDTNLGSGVIITVLDGADHSTPITDANVTLYSSIDPDVQLTGCVHPSGNCSMVGNNTAGQGQNGQYHFSGFSMPATVYVRVEKDGWEPRVYPRSGQPGVTVTSTSALQQTLYIENVPPGKVSLKTPLNNSYTSSTTPTLQWYDYGVDETGYVVQISTDESFSSIHEQASVGPDTTSYTITSALSDNTTYYWHVRADDNVGEGEWSDIWYFTVQSSAPHQPTVLINSGAEYTNTRAVTVTVQGYDFNYCRLSSDGVAWDGWYDFNGDDANYSFVLSEGDGTKTVYVGCKNKAGLEASNSDTITLDATPPSNLVVSINDGNLYTNSTTVSVANSVSGATTCQYDSGSGWQSTTCNTTFSATLTSGDGDKNVCVKASDAAGNFVTECDTIYLDTAPPTTPTAVFPTSAITTISKDFQWQWSESDGTGSGIDYYLVTLSTGATTVETSNTRETKYSGPTRDMNNGNTYVLTVVAFDKAGNSSTALTFSDVNIDLNSPIIRVNNPTSDTNDTTPTINITVSDAVNECQFSLIVNSGKIFIDSSPISVSPPNVCTWDVPSGMLSGDTFSIQVTVTDTAGKSRTLTLPKNYMVDTQAPVVTITSPSSSSVISDTTPTVSFKVASNRVTNDVNLSSIVVEANNASVSVSFDTSNCSLDGNAWNCSFDIPAGSAFTDGSTDNNIFIRAFDYAGNYDDAWVTDLNVDTSDYITINSITAAKTTGIADNTYANGWRFDFNVTFGTSASGDKNKLRIKLNDWVNSSNSSYTIEIDGNARMVYDANVNGVKTTKIYNIKNTYDTTQTVYAFWDHNPATAAIDANFYIEQKIPSSVAAGTYYTTYYIRNYSS